MPEAVRIELKPFGPAAGGDLVVLVGEDLRLGAAAAALAPGAQELIARVAPGERFKGKAGSAMTLLAPQGLGVDRLVVVGVGGEKDRAKHDWRNLGGVVAGKASGRKTTVAVEAPGFEAGPEAVAEMALGARLRAYKFDRYKTRKKDDGEDEPPTRLTFAVADLAGCRKAWRQREGLAAGVILARDLVNEPGNVLDPIEFSRRAEALGKLGVEVEVLDEKTLRKLGFRALLAVGQGSARESRVALMRWRGRGDDTAPLAVVGKGVCFDSGGVSIKPAAGMEDMKGDMAGAACVVGLMHALASRKARANVVGAIGLTENMPDGAAQRPGDIITTLSGQTVEMVNSDAEGRLVLGDLVWYVQDRYKPAAMIDLATLTGAILVALGQEYAGLFCNNDELAQRLIAAGQASGERVWRMPLGPEYDKMIDSKFADMKNTGGRNGGSITGAQFIQRFIRDDLPWAHLDIAGTGMNAPQTDINKSWASGWGVRLLDRFVRDHCEA